LHKQAFEDKTLVNIGIFIDWVYESFFAAPKPLSTASNHPKTNFLTSGKWLLPPEPVFYEPTNPHFQSPYPFSIQPPLSTLHMETLTGELSTWKLPYHSR
jgi:hypothetical protein